MKNSLPDVSFSDIEALSQIQREKETLESIALKQIEIGTVEEKLLALESLDDRKNLSIHTLFELRRLRDIFEAMDSMEEVVEIINHSYLGHHR